MTGVLPGAAAFLQVVVPGPQSSRRHAVGQTSVWDKQTGSSDNDGEAVSRRVLRGRRPPSTSPGVSFLAA